MTGTTARVFNLGSGGITLNSGAGAVTFGVANSGDLNVTLTADQTWTNNSANVLSVGTAGHTGNLTSANVDLGANQLTIDGTGNTNLGISNQPDAWLTGSGALIKNGTGVFSLGGKNTGYSGNVTVNNGVLYYGDSPDALGTGNLLITNGAIEGRWNNAFTRTQGTGAGQIQITGGVSGLGGGNNMTYYIGAITWGSATFNPTEFILQTSNAVDTGRSTLSSSIDLNGDGGTPDINGVVWRTIRSDQAGGNIANGYGTFTGNITNTTGTTNMAGLIKTGIGHHILTGTNTYDGGTTINQGSLLFGKTAAMPASGNVQVNNGGILGIRVGGTGNWTNGTSGAGTIGGLLAGLGGQTGSTVSYTGNVGVQLDMAANTTYSGNIANVGTTLAIYKTGTSTLTLDGNNAHTGGTFLNQGTLIADSANALGATGDITFKGGTLQYTVNSAANDYGSRIANSTSAMLLNTNGQNVGLSGIANTNTGGLTKSGAGALTLSGTNTYNGTTAISAGTFVVDGGTTSIGDLTLASNTSLSVINGGTLNTVGVIGDEGVSNLTWSVIGGGATSTWNLGGSNLYLFGYNPVKSNMDMTIDGAGVAASAIVTNIGTLQWGKSTFDSDLLVTNGGRLNVNSDVQIGSTYYGTTGINNTITIQGGTANSIMTVGRDFYVGFGERAAPSSNTATVGAGGQLTITRDLYVGHANYAGGPATANQLVVTGGGTASAATLSVGYAQNINFAANANVVQVTNGGTLSTTGISYIGRANSAGSQSNDNTMTVSGTSSSWNAGNQNVFVGFANNATATSTGNILTVGSGGSVTNVNTLTVGGGTGAAIGNQLVVSGGSITATTTTVNASNSLEIGASGGSLNGNITNNGALNISSNVPVSLAGDISGSGTITLTGSGITTLSGTNTYTGLTAVNAGILQFAKQESLYNNTAASWTAANINVKSGATFAVNVDSAASAGFDSGSLDTLLTNISVANTAVQGLQAGATLGFDTSTATGSTFTQGNAIANSTGSFGGAIGVTKLGAGTLVLDKANTYTGATTIQAGTLSLGSSDRLSNSTPVTVAGGTLDISTFTDTVASFSMSSGALNGSGTLTAATYLLTGGSLQAKLGAGAVTVNGDVTFSAAGRLNSASTLLIQGGTLTLSGDENVNSFQQTGGIVAGGFSINSATDSELE